VTSITLLPTGGRKTDLAEAALLLFGLEHGRQVEELIQHQGHERLEDLTPFGINAVNWVLKVRVCVVVSTGEQHLTRRQQNCRGIKMHVVQQGSHPKVVQERLGHSQISMTLDTYSHVLPNMQDEAAQKIDESIIPVAVRLQ
jgi:hypothetical protein